MHRKFGLTQKSGLSTALSHLRRQMPKIVAFALEVFLYGETTLVCGTKILIILLSTKFQRKIRPKSLLIKR